MKFSESIRHALCVSITVAMLTGCGGISPLMSRGDGNTPAAFAPANTPVAAVNMTKTFSYTGGQQNFIVPANVKHVTITAIGAASRSRHGGLVTATISVRPGERLAIFVGGEPSGSIGGFNGGGDGSTANGGFGGGGASDVRRNGAALKDRVVVAGGAGGAGGQFTAGTGYVGGAGGAGGAGGGRGGTRGGMGGVAPGVTGGGGGFGGTQQAGGAGGAPGQAADGAKDAGGDGIVGLGGAGGSGVGEGGGGGGGGYYGGGGGGLGGGNASSQAGGGGGGGGSSFVEASASNVNDVRGGAGKLPSRVIISW